MNAASSNYQQIVIANNQQSLLLQGPATSTNSNGSKHGNSLINNLESTPQVQSRISKQARSPSGAI